MSEQSDRCSRSVVCLSASLTDALDTCKTAERIEVLIYLETPVGPIEHCITSGSDIYRKKITQRHKDLRCGAVRYAVMESSR